MNRREFIKTTAIAATCTARGGAVLAEEPIKRDNRPNILFIITDQQHAGMMSCAGNKWLKTPAMDSLAKEGMRFENAYCTNPVCVPSRTSMATGMMPNQLGATDNKRGMQIKNLPREVDENSLGKVVKRAGYATFYGGKVHMCEALVPLNAGYDEYYRDERDGLPQACLDFIQRQRDKPFYAVASFINPHDICFAHRAHNGIDTHHVLALYEEASALPVDQLPPLPENFAIPENEWPAVDASLSDTAVTPSRVMRNEYDERDWRIYRWIYNRLTENVDKHIGMILDGLKDAGLEDNTLIIFTSDHGNMDASHRLASKGFHYEESVGVPLLLKYKGVIPAGRTDQEHLVSTGLDILPTICDYVGESKPAHLSGKSLRPLAEGTSVDGWRRYVVSENGWFRMVRSTQFKYAVSNSVDDPESLIDIKNDPGEMTNLVGNPQFRDELVAHREFLAEWDATCKGKQGPMAVKRAQG